MHRRVWLWLIISTSAACTLLTVGTIAAHRLHQSVEWYSGVGQWLGALGSLLAAITALWIASTDRQRADSQRRAELAELDADLVREAGLVRVRFEKLPRNEAGGTRNHELGIGIRNRRSTRIFDVELHRVEIINSPVPFDPDVIQVDRGRAPIEGLTDCVIEPDQELRIFPEIPTPDVELVAEIQYTDQYGRRWQIDTRGVVTKIGADGLPPNPDAALKEWLAKGWLRRRR